MPVPISTVKNISWTSKMFYKNSLIAGVSINLANAISRSRNTIGPWAAGYSVDFA